MNQRFRIEGRLMGRNEFDRRNREHWSKGNKAKAGEQEKVVAAILAAKLVPMEGPVVIGVTFIEGRPKNGRMRDPDNISGGGIKVIEDALVECGIIPDDGPRHVRNLFYRFAYNASNPHIEVEIMTYNPEGRWVYYPPVIGVD